MLDMFALLDSATDTLIKTFTTKEAALSAVAEERQKLGQTSNHKISVVILDDGGYSEIRA